MPGVGAAGPGSSSLEERRVPAFRESSGESSRGRTPVHPASGSSAARWGSRARIGLISLIAVTMGCLFVTTYSLALGDPIPHEIPAALVGTAPPESQTIAAVEAAADHKLQLDRYRSLADALAAINRQRVYAAVDTRSTPPTLYVASAAGASVARLLEKAAFYLMLVTTIVGFVTVFQVHAHVDRVRLYQWAAFTVALAAGASLVFTLLDGVVLGRLAFPTVETWAILATQLLAVSSFASLMILLVDRWALLPTWLFFVVLGNTSSGRAVAPPLLPTPFAVISQWLPSGATVTSLQTPCISTPTRTLGRSSSWRSGRSCSSRR